MFTIGCLAVQNPEENTYLNFFVDQGWSLSTIKKKERLEESEKLDAIVLFEDTMPTICYWLMELKKQVNVPVYLVSAVDESHSNLVYLQLGVEICFSMKMGPEELYFTLKNILTRYCDQATALIGNKNKSIIGEGLELIPVNLSVIIDGEREISLTKKEFQILEILCNSPGKTILYEEFNEQIWHTQEKCGDKHYRIANIMFHLRNKIETSSANPRFIKTVRSKGYMLDGKTKR